MLASCTKQNSIQLHRDGKDDDDGPIIMEIVRNADHQLLEGCEVHFISGGDTLSGITDRNGSFTARLSAPGDCLIKLSRGDVQVSKSITVTDSITVSTDVLPVP